MPREANKSATFGRAFVFCIKSAWSALVYDSSRLLDRVNLETHVWLAMAILLMITRLLAVVNNNHLIKSS